MIDHDEHLDYLRRHAEKLSHEIEIAQKKSDTMAWIFSVMTISFSMLSVLAFTVSSAGLAQSFSIYIPNGVFNFITNNLLTQTWVAASADARLQFLSTIIVAIPGLAILKIFFKTKKD